MNLKVLEIRDRGTNIAAMAVVMEPDSAIEDYYLERAGFPTEPLVTLIPMEKLYGMPRATWDAYDWKDRTMHVAHTYIEKNFYEMDNGDVVDVEFILGETKVKKTSERRDKI
jgi:hypothetical protein